MTKVTLFALPTSYLNLHYSSFYRLSYYNRLWEGRCCPDICQTWRIWVNDLIYTLRLAIEHLIDEEILILIIDNTFLIRSGCPAEYQASASATVLCVMWVELTELEQNVGTIPQNGLGYIPITCQFSQYEGRFSDLFLMYNNNIIKDQGPRNMKVKIVMMKYFLLRLGRTLLSLVQDTTL